MARIYLFGLLLLAGCTITTTDEDAFGNQVQTPPFKITVLPGLTISGSPSPTASVGDSYSAQFTAAGGRGPYAYSVAAGTLPPGLSLDPSTGVLGGTPPLTHEFTIEVAGKTLGLFGTSGFFLSGASYDVGVFALFIGVLGALRVGYLYRKLDASVETGAPRLPTGKTTRKGWQAILDNFRRHVERSR